MNKTAVCLGEKLYSSEIVFKKRLNQDRWILFAPDYHGLPVVVHDETYEIMRDFNGGKTIFEVVSRTEDAPKALATIVFLQDNGFLRLAPTTMPYQMPSFLEADSPRSVEVWMHLTNMCNLKCSYCFVENKHPETMREEAVDRTAHNLACTARKHNFQKLTIKFAGGEPTLVMPKLESIRSILEEELNGTATKLAFAVLTNGTVLNTRIVDFLKKPNTSISVSIDGYGSVHDTFRIFLRTNKGSWRAIQRNLVILRENGIRPFIMSTISGETCESLPQLVRWINDNGLRTRLNVVRQPDCSWQWNQDTERGYSEVCERLIESFGKTFEELENQQYSFEFVSQLKLADLHFDNPVCGMPCGIGYNHIVVKPDGKIVSCPMSVDEEGIEPGKDLLDACRRSFVWNPLERQKMSYEDECLACTWFPVCAGGCPITNLRMNGHPFSKSPFCRLYKFLIPGFLNLLGRKMIQAEERTYRETHNSCASPIREMQ